MDRAFTGGGPVGHSAKRPRSSAAYGQSFCWRGPSGPFRKAAAQFRRQWTKLLLAEALLAGTAVMCGFVVCAG